MMEHSLKNFKTSKFDHLGFEPSKNVSDLARKKGINSLHEFSQKEFVKS